MSSKRIFPRDFQIDASEAERIKLLEQEWANAFDNTAYRSIFVLLGAGKELLSSSGRGASYNIDPTVVGLFKIESDFQGPFFFV